MCENEAIWSLTKFLHGGPPSLGPSQPADVQDGGDTIWTQQHTSHILLTPPSCTFSILVPVLEAAEETQSKKETLIWSWSCHYHKDDDYDH